jgi:integrase
MKGCRPLTHDEIDKIISSMRTRDKALFILGIKSGFRVSELLSLTIGDFKDENRIKVKRKNMKKRIESRTVALHPEARSAVYDLIKQLHGSGYMSPDDYLFQSRKGKNQAISRVQAWRIINQAAAENGIEKIGTHAMRKTFANRVYEKLDQDLVKTQKALGHRNINSTAQYIAFIDADIDAAILAA